jgi:hypothetical protein
MEVVCSVHSFCPKLDRYLRVNHQSSSFLGDGSDHFLTDWIPMVRVRRVRFICRTTGCEH